MKHSDDIVDLMEFTTKPDHFYVSELWDSSTKSLVDVPNEARSATITSKATCYHLCNSFRKPLIYLRFGLFIN